MAFEKILKLNFREYKEIIDKKWNELSKRMKY